MRSDHELLRLYAESRNERAFRECVERHAGMVHAAALRQVNDASLAEDITQRVFTHLARKASSFSAKVPLAAWLHRATRNESLHALRQQRLRARREHEAAASMNDIETPPPSWDSLRPVLDEALHRLGETDRQALLLRFFQGLELRSVGEQLGLSENAARMRVSRALDKLRRGLARRGIRSTSAALSVTLAAHAAEAAPAHVVSASFLSAMSVKGTVTKIAAGWPMLSKLSVAASLIAFATPVGLRWAEIQAAPKPAERKPSPPMPLLAARPEPKRQPLRPLRNPNDPDLLRLAKIMDELSKQGTDGADRKHLQLLAGQIAMGLSLEQLPDALELLSGLPGGLRSELIPIPELIPILFSRWAELSPTDAVAHLSLLGEGDTAACGALVSVWVAKDPDASLRWAKSLPHTKHGWGSAMWPVLESLAKKDPAAAFAAVDSLRASEHFPNYFRNALLHSALKAHPRETLAWLRKHEPEETRDSAIQAAVSELSSIHPKLAIPEILAQESHAEREVNLRSALAKLARDSPEEVASFCQQLPREFINQRFGEMLGRELVGEVPRQVVSLAEQLPPSVFRDGLVGQIAGILAVSDIPSALKLAGGMADATLRQSALEKVAARWRRVDRPALEQWLRTSQALPIEAREKVLRPFYNPK